MLVAVAGLMFAGTPEAIAAPKVYLMRGLADVSVGLDDLAVKLRKRGIPAIVSSYTAVSSMTEMAEKDHKAGVACPVVIVGHSLGADAGVTMADSLRAAGVSVALLVVFSPAYNRAVPANVARAINYYQSNSYWNNVLSRGAGFKGSLRNVNLAKDDKIDHLNIEKVPRLHAETISMISGLANTCANGKSSRAKTKGVAPQ